MPEVDSAAARNGLGAVEAKPPDLRVGRALDAGWRATVREGRPGPLRKDFEAALQAVAEQGGPVPLGRIQRRVEAAVRRACGRADARAHRGAAAARRPRALGGADS